MLRGRQRTVCAAVPAAEDGGERAAGALGGDGLLHSLDELDAGGEEGPRPEGAETERQPPDGESATRHASAAIRQRQVSGLAYEDDEADHRPCMSMSEVRSSARDGERVSFVTVNRQNQRLQSRWKPRSTQGRCGCVPRVCRQPQAIVIRCLLQHLDRFTMRSTKRTRLGDGERKEGRNQLAQEKKVQEKKVEERKKGEMNVQRRTHSRRPRRHVPSQKMARA